MADRDDRRGGRPPTKGGGSKGGPARGPGKARGGPRKDFDKPGFRKGGPGEERSGPGHRARSGRPAARIFDEAGVEVQAQRTTYSGRTTEERVSRERTSAFEAARPARGASRPAKPARPERSFTRDLEGPRAFGQSTRQQRPRPERDDRPVPPLEPPRKYVYRDTGRAAAGVSGAAGKDRIAKVMARAGLCSRRDAEEWVTAGRVSVNGAIIKSPALDVTPSDRILVDGNPLPARERTRLWLFHKPAGLVTTESDPEGRPTLFDNLPAKLPRVLSIGRLDINTEGLLLLTNDGGLARVLAHPTTGWLRRYRVRVNGKVDPAMIEALRQGVTVDGIEYEPIIATLDRAKGANAWLTLDLSEGKNREVKRVLEHFGLLVTRLIRISFGPFQLGDLPEGEAEEVRSRTLRDQLGERLAQEAEVDFEAPRFEHGDGEAAAPPRKRYDKRKPSEKRAMIESGEAASLEVKRERFSTRRGRVVEVERIALKAPSAESLGDGRVLWRRDGRADPGMERSGRPEREARPARAPRGGRDERRPEGRTRESRDDVKSYGGRSTSGKGAGKLGAGKMRAGKAGASKTSSGKMGSERPRGRPDGKPGGSSGGGRPPRRPSSRPPR